VIGSLRALVLVAAVASSCAPQGTVVRAPDVPFPNDFVEAREWGRVELVLDHHVPAGVATLDGLVASLRGYMAAGIRASRPGSGVTIEIPDGASSAREVHLFVTVVGGANEHSAGSQFRIVARRDARGWSIDPVAEGRVYCDVPLGGFSGDACW
jgi:hypothetical protein